MERIINSKDSLSDFIKEAFDLWLEHKYFKIKVSCLGGSRSLPQNALCHVWLTEYCAHKQQIDKKAVSSSMLASFKRAAKLKCYLETSQKFLVHKTPIFFDGQKHRIDCTSSSDWDRGEMFFFLEWLQSDAAKSGLILESKGEFEQLKLSQ
jgi:hypothetical protein